MYKTDVLIIGAGAVGVAISRELARYKLNVMVVDKNDDIGGDASKSNSGLASTSATMVPGSLENRLRSISRSMIEKMCEDLDVPIDHCGSIYPVLYPEQMDTAKDLLERAFINGVYDFEYLPKEDILAMEPSLNPEIYGGLYSPRDYQISQFLMVIAEAENAAENGVEFLLDAKVTGITCSGPNQWHVSTQKGEIEAKWLVNAAGLFCDDIARMAGEVVDFTVHPRKGEFYVLDPDTSVKVSHIISSIPSPKTRGVLVVPTVDGNMLVGPTADDVEDKYDKKTTKKGLDTIREQALKMVPGLQFSDTIRQFVGVRPAREPEGYNFVFNGVNKGYIGISGIRSTGLVCSLAIAKYVVKGMQEAGLEADKKVGFIRTRKGIVSFSDKSPEEKDRLIAQDPAYGRIVCRCEQVTEGEILQAIHRPVGARSVDAVKRRVRAGMGRCQSGFCGPQVIRILARELGVPEEEIRLRGGSSYMLDHE